MRCDAMRAMDGRAAARGLGWRVSSETSRTDNRQRQPSRRWWYAVCGREGSADAMRVLESNKRRQPETRQQQLLNQESKNTPSLCSFLLRHHSLPSPPQKAGPTACAGMCCSRPAGGGVVQVEWLAQLLRRLLLGPARNARVIKGMIGTLGTNAQTRARANRSRAWVAAVSLVLLLLLLLLLLCRRMCCRRRRRRLL